MIIDIVKGDILTQDVDVIINPANTHLAHGGGLARLIGEGAIGPWVEREEYHYSGGPVSMPDEIGQAWIDEQRDAPLVATGDAIATSAGHLPFKNVIHAVGPVWAGGTKCERQLLMEAHMSAFQIADGLDVKSIAVPAISCGIFGYPVERAAYIALMAADAYSYVAQNLEEIRFVLFTDEHYQAYTNAEYELENDPFDDSYS